MSGAISPRSLVTKHEVLIYVDYSESYENKQQREIQSAYFGHTRFSILTACCYLRDIENKMICEFVTISRELSDLSRAAAFTNMLTVMDHLREKHQHVSLKNTFIVWRGGWSTQFPSQFVFKLLSSTDSSLNITWWKTPRQRAHWRHWRSFK